MKLLIYNLLPTSTHYHHQYIKFFVSLSVRLCVCDRCGRGRNEFAGRVQNNHVRFSFHRNGHNEIVKAAAGLA